MQTSRVSARLGSIQILRGVAALLVVIAHVIEHPLAQIPNAVFVTGRFGVDIFFVISGFIIMYVTPDGPFAPFGFAARRLLRIVPLYWVCTVAVFALAIVAPSAFKQTPADWNYFLHSLAFVPMPRPGTTADWRPLLKLGWSLQYEMFFYLLIALLFWCRSRLQRATIVTVLLAPLVALSLFVEPRAGLFAHYANVNHLGFLAGVWLAVAHRAGIFDRIRDGDLSPAAAVATLAVGATTVLYGDTMPEILMIWDQAPMTIAAAAIVATGLYVEAWSRGRSPVLERIGDWSYSLYLTHMFVVGAAWSVAGRLHLASPVALIGLGLATVAVSLVVAALSWRLIEVPANAFGRRFAIELPERWIERLHLGGRRAAIH